MSREFRILVGSITVAAFVATLFCFFTTTAKKYDGLVSESKVIRSGVLIDLDGQYPNQKMILFLPTAIAREWSSLNHGWPKPGTRIVAVGNITKYKGRTEIVISKVSQLEWKNGLAPSLGPMVSDSPLDLETLPDGYDQTTDYDPEDHDLSFLNADQIGWIAFGLILLMVSIITLGLIINCLEWIASKIMPGKKQGPTNKVQRGPDTQGA